MRPRIGHIQYLNCLPLYYGLIINNNKDFFNMDLVKGTPTELNNKLLNGELDVSPISAIEYCRHSDKLLLLPELTVSSFGEVKSILLISKTDIKSLNNKKVALTTSSATSRILTHIILKEKYNLDIEYIDAKPDLEETLKEAEAVLLIGDDALKVLYTNKKYMLYDLGLEWQELTGKPMVYAVWATSIEFAKNNPEILQNVFAAFISSMEYSSSRFREVAVASSRWEIFDADFLYEYFKSLRFEFGRNYQDGLKHFYDFALKYNKVDKVPEFNFANVASNSKTFYVPSPFDMLTTPPMPMDVFSFINKSVKNTSNFLKFITPPKFKDF